MEGSITFRKRYGSIAILLIVLGAVIALFFVYQAYELGWCNVGDESCEAKQATAEAYMWAGAVGGFVALAGFVFLMAYYVRTSPSR